MSQILSKRNENDDTSLSSTESVGRTSAIQFTTIEVREFNRILGDNPACSRGPPVSLDWDYTDTETLSLDEYETNRIPRRPTKKLVMSTRTRRTIMSNQLGYTRDEIIEAENSMKKIQKNRRKTTKENPTLFKTRLFAENARGLILCNSGEILNAVIRH